MNVKNILLENINTKNLSEYVDEICGLFNQAGWSSDQNKLCQIFEIKGARGLCAIRQGKVIGFVYYILYEFHAWTGYVNVDIKSRNQGVATLLKSKMISECNKMGINSIRLITSNNLMSLNISLGFYFERSILNYSTKIVESESDLDFLLGGSNIDMSNIIELDRVVFKGDRSARLLTHMSKYPSMVWTIEDHNSLKGYALAWLYPKSLRVGPVVCDDNHLTELMENVFGFLINKDINIDILVYEDDAAMINICKNKGLSCVKREVQLLYSKITDKQHPMLRTVWGRATG